MIKHAIASVAACVFLYAAQAQDCAKFLFLQKDKVVEMTIYNKKGEANGRQVYSVQDVSTSGGTVSAKINSEMFDKNGSSRAKAASANAAAHHRMMLEPDRG